MKIIIAATLMLISFGKNVSAQNLRADVKGIYECPNSLYRSFEFNGNAGVRTGGVLTEVANDFFVYNDTLVIYPDKDVFRFIIQKDGSLKGISIWVMDSIWKKTSDKVSTEDSSEKVTTQKLNNMYRFEKTMEMAQSNSITEDQFTQVMKSLESLCDLTYGRACNKLGSYLSYSEGEERSMAVWQKGCEYKDVNSCKNIANVYLLTKKDEANAKIYFNKACALGDFGSCAWDFEIKLQREQELAEKVKKQNQPEKRKKS